MATANRTRDSFLNNDTSSLFRSDQSLGRWFSEAVDLIAQKNKRILITDRDGNTLSLKKRREWRQFIDKYFSDNEGETARRRSENLSETLGITFVCFICFLDDVLVTPDDEDEFDATKNSALADLVNLYDLDGRYAHWVDWNAFYSDRIPSEPINSGSEKTMRLGLIPSIDPSIMEETTGGIFGRDREEVEAQKDFISSKESRRLFQENTGTELWEPLDIEDLESIDWTDDSIIDRILEFQAPVHPEKLENGGYADRNEPFLEMYLDTEDGLLEKNDLSLRARIRPEQDRGLIQMKLELEPNPTTGHPVREKWERRLRGPTFLGDIPADLSQMIYFAQFGHAVGSGMPEIKKLYELLKSKGALSDKEPLVLREDHIIFQRRRRGRLRLDSIDILTQRLEQLRNLSAEPNAHNNLKKLLDHVVEQHRIYKAAADAISIHTPDNQLGGEAVILSADRWSVFEPGAWKKGEFPGRLSGPGRRGRGLRFETELDASTSEVFAEALTIIEKKLNEGGDSQELNKHKAAIKAWRAKLWQDVTKAAELMSEKLESVGITRIENPLPSKSLQASAMIRQGQEGFRRGHRFWV